ncbi:MAG: ROK family protein [Bifidobacteriaceae bacterium]|nr:ROK family protein [Bifidobacteriaceae bacterium]
MNSGSRSSAVPAADADVLTFPRVATVSGPTVSRRTKIAEFADFTFQPQVSDVPEVEPGVIAIDIGSAAIKGAIVVGWRHPDASPERTVAPGVQGAGGALKSVKPPDSPRILMSRSVETPLQAGPSAIVAAVIELISGLLRDALGVVTVKGIGIGAPGVVDGGAGIVRTAQSLGWADVPLGQLVHEQFDQPVGVGQDVRAAALAEWRWGAGRGKPDMVFVAAGSGVASAVIVDGNLVYGDGYAGEIGHGGGVSGELCSCGGRGCLETYASGGAIARLYEQAAGRSVDGADEVVALADDGDAQAQQIWERAVDGLAEAISAIVRLLGAPRVVIGGGMVNAEDSLMVPLAAGVRSRLTIHRPAEVLPAAMGSRAGLYGAAMLGVQAANA